MLKKGTTGKFRFNLVATNGQVIATSEAYETKRAAMNGIKSVRNNAPDAELDDQTAAAPAKKAPAKQAAKKKATKKKAAGKKRATKKRAAKKSG